jgi:stage III sporulation protein AF
LEFLKGWIINIVVTMIFVTFIEIMVPEGSMRKYINLVVGLLVMIVIINPFLNLLASDFDMGSKILEMSRAIDLKDTKLQAENLETGQRENIVRVYKNRLEEQIARQVMETNLTASVRAEVFIDEDYESEGFGNIESIRVIVLNAEQNEKKSGKVEVDKVEIKINTKSDENAVSIVSQHKGRIEQDISDYLAGIYGISPDSIDVIIQKPEM